MIGSMHFKHLSYIIRHKWYVMLECFKCGLYWRGITHDLSKLRPEEFLPYSNYFHGDIKRGRDSTGYYKPTDTGDASFDYAWFLHQKRNDHHWQWWVYPDEGEKVKVLKMSHKAMVEMLCDWRGAGIAQGTPDTLAWYTKNKHKMLLHPETRTWIEKEIGYKE